MKKIILFILAALAMLGLCSCGAKFSDDEIKTALDQLLPKSFELNVAYFGEGLPISEDKEVLDQFYSGFDSDVAMLNYHPVAADCPYQTEEDLKNATLEVFTEDYAEYLFKRAFSGISDKLENVDGETVTYSAVYAMYIEENGVLTVRLNLAEEALPLDREYRTEGMQIISQRKNVVTVSVPTYIDGEYDTDARLRLVKTPDGWRLDSPTY